MSLFSKVHLPPSESASESADHAPDLLVVHQAMVVRVTYRRLIRPPIHSVRERRTSCLALRPDGRALGRGNHRRAEVPFYLRRDRAPSAASAGRRLRQRPRPDPAARRGRRYRRLRHLAGHARSVRGQRREARPPAHALRPADGLLRHSAPLPDDLHLRLVRPRRQPRARPQHACVAATSTSRTAACS